MKLSFYSLLFLIFISGANAFAKTPALLERNLTVTDKTIEAAQRQLIIEQQRNDINRTMLQELVVSQQKQLKSFGEKGNFDTLLNRANLNLAVAQTNLDSADIAYQDAKQALLETQDTIRAISKQLQRSLIAKETSKTTLKQERAGLENQLDKLKALLKLQQSRVKILQVAKDLAQEKLDSEQKWRQQVKVLLQQRKQHQRRLALAATVEQLQARQELWLNKLAKLDQQFQRVSKQESVDNAKTQALSFEILVAQEHISLSGLQLFLTRLEARIQDLIAVTHKGSELIENLNDAKRQADDILQEVGNTTDLIQSKIQLLEKHKTTVSENEASDAISPVVADEQISQLNGFLIDYRTLLSKINALQKTTANHQKQLTNQLQKHISSRQTLPGFSLEAWSDLAQKILVIPNLFWQAVKGLVSSFVGMLANLQGLSLYLFIIGVIAWLILLFTLKKYLLTVSLRIKEKRQRFSANMVYIVLELIRRNVASIFVFIGLLIINSLVDVRITLFVLLLSVYLGFNLLVTLTQILLLESVTDTSGKDVRLYHNLKRAFVLGGLLTTLSVLTNHLPVAYEVRSFFNRALMVFLLIVALTLLKGWAVLPGLIRAKTNNSRPYLLRVVTLLSLVLPLALFSNALIGVIGYVEFAWMIAWYQGIFIIALTSYVILRGLLVDVMEFASELLIKHVQNGWVLTEAILKPLDRVLRISLIVFILMALFHVYGLDRNESFVQGIRNLSQLHLLSIGTLVITPWVLIKFAAIVYVLYWLVRWSREFAFRWLYVKAKDIGVRNSLAIFTQYSIIVLVALVGLKILGVDLRGLAVVLAAFAAGLAFGLRDIIANFFSGLLLLVERPFRTGDVIALGDYEGRVIHTGMRSITIHNWDHMEVIVPNSEIFNKPFINWTHQDNIIRTVITLKVSRQDDLQKIQQLVMDVLEKHPKIRRDPIPEVFIYAAAESLVEMQVRYYICIPECDRAEVRSEVLFAIWECFKANGIRSPYPSYDVHVHEK